MSTFLIIVNIMLVVATSICLVCCAKHAFDCFKVLVGSTKSFAVYAVLSCVDLAIMFLSFVFTTVWLRVLFFGLGLTFFLLIFVVGYYVEKKKGNCHASIPVSKHIRAFICAFMATLGLLTIKLVNDYDDAGKYNRYSIETIKELKTVTKTLEITDYNHEGPMRVGTQKVDFVYIVTDNNDELFLTRKKEGVDYETLYPVGDTISVYKKKYILHQRH